MGYGSWTIIKFDSIDPEFDKIIDPFLGIIQTISLIFNMKLSTYIIYIYIFFNETLG